jgi:Stress responsive A/B Barrel Domain
VVMAKFKSGVDPAAAEALYEQFRTLSYPGMVSFAVGPDLGLREGNWSMSIVADFATEADYRIYDEDPEHNRMRAELAPLVDQIARVQFTC